MTTEEPNSDFGEEAGEEAAAGRGLSSLPGPSFSSSSSSSTTTTVFFPDLNQFEYELSQRGEDDYAVNDWALSKIGTLQAKLEQMQHLKDTKKYSGASGGFLKFPRSAIYNLANEVFGFNGWSTEILECTTSEIRNDVPTRVLANPRNDISGTAEDANSNSTDKARFVAYCTCRILLTLLDGTSKEGLGFGTATNLPHKYMCYAKCKKEAVTDAIKNAILGLRDLYFVHESNQLLQELNGGWLEK
ncbi:uncharacterized protein LODBEIA_P51010 [Lodderomyces beijingensis]|uniref:DNA repair and recombination protein RAD52 n=1 Tax=Lodderomyces beijingensis TaxID=1775926 RepID=A0ABP0ZVX2_9ASCO